MRAAAVVAAAAAVLSVYVAMLVAMPPGGFYSPDEGTKFLQLESIGWDGGLRYDVPYGGAAVDPEFAFYPTRCRHEDLYPVRLPDGSVKLHWPIWFALITRPAVELLGLRGLYVVPLLSGWLAALLSGRLARAYDPRLSPLAILAVGLATPIAFFSLTHWEHTPATLLGLAALVLIVERRGRRWAGWAAAALLLAAVVLRLETLPFAVAVGAAAWVAARAGAARERPARRPLTWLASAAVLAAAAVALSLGFLPARHLWLLQELPSYSLATLAKLPHLPGALVAALVGAPGNRAPDLAGWLRAAALVVFAAAAAAPFVRREPLRTAIGLAAAFLALDFSLWLGLLPDPYISLHGLLPVAPFVVLAAWAFPDAWRSRRPDRLALTTAAGVYLLLGFGLLFTFTVETDGTYRTGLEWGNRYLLTLYPLAAVLALGGARAWRAAIEPPLRRGIVTAVVVGLFLCGLQMEARGLSVLYRGRTLVATWQAALAGDAPVVTDVWWLPAAMAPYFAAHPMHCVRDPADLATWIAAAHAHGTGALTFASFRYLDAGRIPAAPLAVRATGYDVVSGLHVMRYRVGDPAAPR